MESDSGNSLAMLQSWPADDEERKGWKDDTGEGSSSGGQPYRIRSHDRQPNQSRARQIQPRFACCRPPLLVSRSGVCHRRVQCHHQATQRWTGIHGLRCDARHNDLPLEITRTLAKWQRRVNPIQELVQTDRVVTTVHPPSAPSIECVSYEMDQETRFKRWRETDVNAWLCVPWAELLFSGTRYLDHEQRIAQPCT